MNRRHLIRIDKYVMLWGALSVVLSLLIGKDDMVLGAFVGAALASANWAAFRYLALRMAAAGNRLRLGVFLGAKTLAIFGAIALVLAFLPVHPVAFVGGLSSIVLGIFTYSFKQSLYKGETVLGEDF